MDKVFSDSADIDVLQEALDVYFKSDDTDTNTDTDTDTNTDTDSIASTESVDVDNGEDTQKELIPPYGCKHYLRRCKLITPCCDQIFPCRLCHDEKMDNIDIKAHTLDRFSVKYVMCTPCGLVQDVSNKCIRCGTTFGLYFCEICKLYDDIDNDQYHCEKCGLCRVQKKLSFHCDGCNTCLSKTNEEYEKNHKCLDMKGFSCPVCMDDLFVSTSGVVKMKCSHYIHKNCFIELLKTSYKCPYCSSSVVDMSYVNQMIEQEVVNTPMPEEYRDMKVGILCNDCHKKSDTNFHIVGMKCQFCGSYNTRQT